MFHGQKDVQNFLPFEELSKFIKSHGRMRPSKHEDLLLVFFDPPIFLDLSINKHSFQYKQTYQKQRNKVSRQNCVFFKWVFMALKEFCKNRGSCSNFEKSFESSFDRAAAPQRVVASCRSKVLPEDAMHLLGGEKEEVS